MIERITLADARRLAETNDDFVIGPTGVRNVVYADYRTWERENFDDPLACELRGAKFDAETGALLARPLHEFLAIDLATDVERLDQPHVVTPKIDGTLIHPLMLPGGVLFWLARTGIVRGVTGRATEVAYPGHQILAEQLLDRGFTPSFEWTSPGHRIVVEYLTPRLTLLAVRHVETGVYLPHGEVTELAAEFDVPVVAALDWQLAWATVERVRTQPLSEGEGVVARWLDGYTVKIQSDAYVRARLERMEAT